MFMPFHVKTANDHIATGESGRDCEKRLSEHKRAIRNGDANNALFVHMSTQNHPMDWENTKLIYKEKDEKKRKIVEAAVKNANLNDGFYKFNSLTTNYVIDWETIKQLNGQIIVQGDVT